MPIDGANDRIPEKCLKVYKVVIVTEIGGKYPDVMNITSTPIIYVSRFLGLFPFVVEKSGHKLILKWSLKYAVYSAILGCTLSILTIKGIIDDVEAGSTKSIRIKQTTGKIVTIVDISIIVLIVFVGIFGIYSRISNFLAFVNCLNEIDSMLVISDGRKARKMSIIRVVTIFTLVTIILVFDMLMWWSIGHNTVGSNYLLVNYLTFYISYYPAIMLECQYWHLIYCVQRRIALLNDCLQFEQLTEKDIFKNVQDKAFAVFKPSSVSSRISATAKNMNNIMDVLENRKKVSDLFFTRNAKRIRSYSTEDSLIKLKKIYLLLCDAAECINKCCGFPILIILLSCLLHLVVTPYFMVIELTGRNNPLFLTLQAIWIFTHLSRLVVIVEACYSCTVEVKNTKPLICKLLCYDFDDKIKRELELFAGELNYRQIEFTACGLFTIDRTLITTIAGAVTTYLVILIQFQKNDKS